jgi:hypothetical protein
MMRKSRVPTSVESTWMARALIRDAFAGGVLQETSRASWLSGGAAIHYDPVADTRAEKAAWSYLNPSPTSSRSLARSP